jgi:hypothetical protein
MWPWARQWWICTASFTRRKLRLLVSGRLSLVFVLPMLGRGEGQTGSAVDRRARSEGNRLLDGRPSRFWMAG